MKANHVVVIGGGIGGMCVQSRPATPGSKAYELRTTTSLTQLLAKLAEIYNWFTEGFDDTADLKDATAQLDELSS